MATSVPDTVHFVLGRSRWRTTNERGFPNAFNIYHRHIRITAMYPRAVISLTFVSRWDFRVPCSRCNHGFPIRRCRRHSLNKAAMLLSAFAFALTVIRILRLLRTWSWRGFESRGVALRREMKKRQSVLLVVGHLRDCLLSTFIDEVRTRFGPKTNFRWAAVVLGTPSIFTG